MSEFLLIFQSYKGNLTISLNESEIPGDKLQTFRCPVERNSITNIFI